MTHRDLRAVMVGASRYLEFQFNLAMRAAWHTAAFTRTEKMPKLDRVLYKRKPLKHAQTWEQQLAAAQAWTAVLRKKAK